MTSHVGFAAQAAQNPTRYYRRPGDVVNDRRLSREEKLAVLEAWELEARALAVASEENMGGGEPDLLAAVVTARLSLEEEPQPRADTGAPTKQGARNSGTA